MDWLNLLSRQPQIVRIYMGGGHQANLLVCHLHHHLLTSFINTCSSKRSSQSLWLATTFTSLLAPLRPMPHCPASPSLPSKVILTSSTQTVRLTQQWTVIVALQLSWTFLGGDSLTKLPPWPIVFLIQLGVFLWLMSPKVFTIKHLMSDHSSRSSYL